MGMVKRLCCRKSLQPTELRFFSSVLKPLKAIVQTCGMCLVKNGEFEKIFQNGKTISNTFILIYIYRQKLLCYNAYIQRQFSTSFLQSSYLPHIFHYLFSTPSALISFSLFHFTIFFPNIFSAGLFFSDHFYSIAYPFSNTHLYLCHFLFTHDFFAAA